MKPVFQTILFLILLTGNIGCQDRITHRTIGVIIDAETKIPIDSVLVKDAKSDYSVITDSTGRFLLKYFKSPQIIEIRIQGYKPFYLETQDEYDEKHVKFKSYKLRDERIYNEKTHEEKEINSNIFKVINGDSVVIELKRIKNK